jgi:hypothetical protein
MAYADLTDNQKEGCRWLARLGKFNQGRPIINPTTGKPSGQLFSDLLMAKFGDEGYLDKLTWTEEARRRKIGVNPALANPIDSQPDPPLVFSCVPATGPKAGGGTITINGEGFVAGMAVRFICPGGTSVATGLAITNQTTATVTLPAASPNTYTGPVKVEVETALGPASLDVAFSYV